MNLLQNPYFVRESGIVMKARVLLCLAARQVCMCLETFLHCYLTEELSDIHICQQIGLPRFQCCCLEPCPAHTVQLRLSELIIFPTTASCIFHHTSGGVWTISHKYYRLLSDLIDNILSKTSLQISRMILELEEKSLQLPASKWGKGHFIVC